MESKSIFPIIKAFICAIMGIKSNDIFIEHWPVNFKSNVSDTYETIITVRYQEKDGRINSISK